MRTPDWAASEAYLRVYAADLLTDAAEAVLQMLIESNPGRQELEQHLLLLRLCREMGIEATYRLLADPPSQEEFQRLAVLLDEWIQTPDWAASESFLREHEADLLSDQAVFVLQVLRWLDPDKRAIEQHVRLLHLCRKVGIEEAYRQFRGDES